MSTQLVPFQALTVMSNSKKTKHCLEPLFELLEHDEIHVKLSSKWRLQSASEHGSEERMRM